MLDMIDSAMKATACLLALLSVASALGQQLPVSGNDAVPHRGVYEVRLDAGGPVEDPYLGVRLQVTFSTPGGREVTVDGFFDGGVALAAELFVFILQVCDEEVDFTVVHGVFRFFGGWFSLGANQIMSHMATVRPRKTVSAPMIGPTSVPRPPTAVQITISIELAGENSPGLMMPTCGT